MKRVALFGAATLCVVACGDDVAHVVGDAMVAVGDAARDAAAALRDAAADTLEEDAAVARDAGEALRDSGRADAQEDGGGDGGPSESVVEAACEVVGTRDVFTRNAAGEVTTHTLTRLWARRFPVGFDSSASGSVRGVVCGPLYVLDNCPLTDPPRCIETGEVLHASDHECAEAPYVAHGDGYVQVGCGTDINYPVWTGAGEPPAFSQRWTTARLLVRR